MLCPTLDISRVSNISTVVGKEESRVGPGGGEVWPGREESSQVRGRKRERGPGEGGEISKSQNFSQVETFISHSLHSCKSNLERSVTMLASSSLLPV